MSELGANLDTRTVDSFGEEWSTFDQRGTAPGELERLFSEYFSVFPWDDLPSDATGFDLGCGSGRWARFVAPRVGTLHCIDASAKALTVAARTLEGQAHCVLHHASVDAIPLPDESMDFGYSLGVLHHVPDTARGLAACVRKLRPGAPFLLYLYYALDNRGFAYRSLWRASDVLRGRIARLPHGARLAITRLIAALVYLPAARSARVLESLGVPVSGLPLSFYRHRSFYTMQTDSYDRFATPLEQRFTRGEIEAMMRAAGLRAIRFREAPPYWCAVGVR
jgi:SAM-dependent methyltransferase